MLLLWLLLLLAYSAAAALDDTVLTVLRRLFATRCGRSSSLSESELTCRPDAEAAAAAAEAAASFALTRELYAPPDALVAVWRGRGPRDVSDPPPELADAAAAAAAAADAAFDPLTELVRSDNADNPACDGEAGVAAGDAVEVLPLSVPARRPGRGRFAAEPDAAEAEAAARATWSACNNRLSSSLNPLLPLALFVAAPPPREGG